MRGKERPIIEVQLSGGEVARVKVDYMLAGLAVHRSQPGDVTSWGKGVKWAVTHARSGMAVGRYPSKDAALLALRALVPLTNWDRPREEIETREIHDKVKHLVGRENYGRENYGNE